MGCMTTNTTAPTFHGRLAQARRFLGITQRDFGALVGVSRETVSAWENGKAAPDVNQLTLLADVLERDVCWFVENLPTTGPSAGTDGCSDVPLPLDFSGGSDPPSHRDELAA